MLEPLYRKITDKNGNIIFELANEDDIIILGRPLSEIEEIIRALDFERILGIKMTMENLNRLYEESVKQEKHLFQRQAKELFEDWGKECGRKKK